MKELLSTGRKVIRPTRKQIEAKNIALLKDKQIILYGGAIRGGKSYWLVLMFHSFCVQYPGSKWVLLRESDNTLKRTLIPTFLKLYNEGLAPYIKSFNQQTQTITYNNGSQLLFMSESYDRDKELNRFRGLEINGAGVDELNEIHIETFNKLIERAGSHILSYHVPIKILTTCNPSGNWVKERFYDRWKTNSLPNSWAYIPAKITDNPFVPADYLSSLKENLPDLMYQKFVNGDWDVVENDSPFADQFNYERHVKECVFDPSQDVYFSFDFNIVNTCLVIQNIDNEIRVLNEYHVKGWDLERLCYELSTDYPAFQIINGDASGSNQSAITSGNASAYDQIKSFLRLSWNNFYVPSANPSHLNSRLLTNLVLKKEKVLIDPKCKGLIKDLQLVKVLKGGKIDKSDDNLTHHLDPFRYHIHQHHYDCIRKYELENFENNT